MRFDCLSAADGLSFSLTKSILQDQQGFMWFGTRYGLDKYDGSDFTVYLPGPSGDLMGGNYILGLYQDRAGDLWMSTTIDLIRWDRKTGEFVHYQHDPANPNSLTLGTAYTIREDAAGTIWVGTYGGLNRYNPSTETFTRFYQGQPVFEIYTDRQGGIWSGTDRGLWYYSSGSLEQQDPVQYQHDSADPSSLSSDLVVTIYEDRQGVIWVGTWDGGLNRFDAATGKFARFQRDPEDPQSLSDEQVTSILEDHAGRLWIGTDNGLNLLDRATGRFSQYHFDPSNPQGLHNSVVNDIYQDRSGVIWIATLAGICKVNETVSTFTFYQQGSNPVKGAVPSQSNLEAESQPAGGLDLRSPPRLSDNLITSVYQDRNGILWVGTSQGGLNRLDRNTGQVTVYRNDPADPTSISWGEVSAKYGDPICITTLFA